jgi:hypothetical protein
VSEARDHTQAANPAQGLIGIESGIFANGTDNNISRVAIDISVGKGVSAGTINTTSNGLRIAPTNLDVTQGQLINGITLQGNMTVGVQVSSIGAWGIQLSGTYTVGIDLGTATTNTSAIRIKNGDNMAFDAASLYRLRHQSGAIPGLTYSVSGADKVLFSDVGGIVLTETIAWTSAYSFATATAGTGGALPAQVVQYIKINVQGTDYKIPYYNL